MKLSELYHRVKLSLDKKNAWNDPEVVVQVSLPYETVGVTPSVSINNIINGTDWDYGKFILQPRTLITHYDKRLNDKIETLQKEITNLKLKNKNLEEDLKKLKGYV